jgi:hypothetical protein
LQLLAVHVPFLQNCVESQLMLAQGSTAQPANVQVCPDGQLVGHVWVQLPAETPSV